MSQSIQIQVTQVGLEQSIAAAMKRVGSSAQINLGTNSRQINALSQPLGRITGQADEFSKSMAAANARVLAFGASAGIIAGVSKAMSGLVTSTIKVEKSLTEINSVLNKSGSELDKFGQQIFNVAKNTGKSFDEVASGALELARQGLNAEDTLARLNDALILSRLSGLDAAQSVEGLTAAFNSFQKSGITTAEILNKVVAVSQKYAVSERDIIEGVKRSASVAQQAGVSFEELAAVITAVQQTTARGGAVIGNSFKTIFARIQRKDVLADLDNMGIAVTDLQGNVLPALRILENLAGKLNNFSQIEQADIAEKLGGVFQLDKLLAALKDISSEASVTSGALEVMGKAGNSAYQKNAVLNQTLAALLNKVAVSAEQLGAKLGEIGVTDSLKNVLGFFNGLLEGIQKVLGEESGLGTMVRGLVKGLGNFLGGPGLAIFGAIILKLSKDLVQFGFASLKTFFGIGKAAQEVKNVEGAISQILAKNVNLQQQLFALEGNRAAQLRVITGALVEQEALLRRSANISSGLGTPLYNAGVRATGSGLRIGNSADGYMPAVAKESKAIKQGVGGARSGDKPVVMPNFNFGGGKKGTMVAHTGEYVVPNFNGSGGTAVFNRQMVQSMGLPSGAKKINAAGGLIPATPKGYSLSSFAGVRIDNPRARTQFGQRKNKNIEPDDKISTVGFNLEKIPIPEELEIALRERKPYLGRDATYAFELIAIKHLKSKGLPFRLGSRSLSYETSSSVDGYNFADIVNKKIELLEVKSGKWDPLEVGNKFGRFVPENVANYREPFYSKLSQYFDEGIKEDWDVIKLKNTLAVPDTEIGRDFIRKDKNKNEILSYSGFSTKSIATKIRRKKEIEDAANAVGGFIPNFAEARPKAIDDNIRKYIEAGNIENYIRPGKDEFGRPYRSYWFPDGTQAAPSQVERVRKSSRAISAVKKDAKEAKMSEKGIYNINAKDLGGIALISPKFGAKSGALDTNMNIAEIPFFNFKDAPPINKDKYIKLSGIQTAGIKNGDEVKTVKNVEAEINDIFKGGVVDLAYRLYGKLFSQASDWPSILNKIASTKGQQLLPPAAQGDLLEAASKIAVNSWEDALIKPEEGDSYLSPSGIFSAKGQNRPFDFANRAGIKEIFGIDAERGEAKRGGEKNFEGSRQVQGIIKKVFNDSVYSSRALKILKSQGAFNLSEAQKAAQAGNAFSGYIPNFAQIGQFIGSGQESDVFRKGNRVIKYSKGDQRQASEKAQLNKAMNWAAAKNQLLNIYPNLRILQNQQRGAATIQPFAGETGRKVIKDKLKAFKLSDLIDRKFEEARSKNSAQPNWLSPLFFDSDPGNFTFLNGVKGDVNSASVEEIFNANKFGLIDMGVLPLRLPDIKKRAAGGFIPNFASRREMFRDLIKFNLDSASNNRNILGGKTTLFRGVRNNKNSIFGQSRNYSQTENALDYFRNTDIDKIAHDHISEKKLLPFVSASTDKDIAEYFARGRRDDNLLGSGVVGSKTIKNSRIFSEQSIRKFIDKYGEKALKDLMLELSNWGSFGSGKGMAINFQSFSQKKGFEGTDFAKEISFFSNGFIPNFADLRLNKQGKNRSREIEHKDRVDGYHKSYLEYSKIPDNPDLLNLSTIKSYSKGHGLQMFNKLGTIARKSGRKVYSSMIIPQRSKLDDLSDKSSKEDILKAMYPQLLYRQRSNSKNTELEFFFKETAKTLTGKNIFDIVKNEFKRVSPKNLINAFRNDEITISEVIDNFAGGYIPNYANPLQAAVNREMAAGVPASQIYIDKSPALKNAANPMGLMVANRRDEPAGGFQGVNRARREGANPMMYGAASGFVPNFAMPPQAAQYQNQTAPAAPNDKAASDSNKTLIALVAFQSAISVASGFLDEAGEGGKKLSEALQKVATTALIFGGIAFSGPVKKLKEFADELAKTRKAARDSATDGYYKGYRSGRAGQQTSGLNLMGIVGGEVGRGVSFVNKTASNVFNKVRNKAAGAATAFANTDIGGKVIGFGKGTAALGRKAGAVGGFIGRGIGNAGVAVGGLLGPITLAVGGFKAIGEALSGFRTYSNSAAKSLGQISIYAAKASESLSELDKTAIDAQSGKNYGASMGSLVGSFYNMTGVSAIASGISGQKLSNTNFRGRNLELSNVSEEQFKDIEKAYITSYVGANRTKFATAEDAAGVAAAEFSKKFEEGFFDEFDAENILDQIKELSKDAKRLQKENALAEAMKNAAETARAATLNLQNFNTVLGESEKQINYIKKTVFELKTATEVFKSLKEINIDKNNNLSEFEKNLAKLKVSLDALDASEKIGELDLYNNTGENLFKISKEAIKDFEKIKVSSADTFSQVQSAIERVKDSRINIIFEQDGAIADIGGVKFEVEELRRILGEDYKTAIENTSEEYVNGIKALKNQNIEARNSINLEALRTAQAQQTAAAIESQTRNLDIQKSSYERIQGYAESIIKSNRAIDDSKFEMSLIGATPRQRLSAEMGRVPLLKTRAREDAAQSYKQDRIGVLQSLESIIPSTLSPNTQLSLKSQIFQETQAIRKESELEAISKKTEEAYSKIVQQINEASTKESSKRQNTIKTLQSELISGAGRFSKSIVDAGINFKDIVTQTAQTAPLEAKKATLEKKKDKLTSETLTQQEKKLIEKAKIQFNAIDNAYSTNKKDYEEAKKNYLERNPEIAAALEKEAQLKANTDQAKKLEEEIKKLTEQISKINTPPSTTPTPLSGPIPRPNYTMASSTTDLGPPPADPPPGYYAVGGAAGNMGPPYLVPIDAASLLPPIDEESKGKIEAVPPLNDSESLTAAKKQEKEATESLTLKQAELADQYAQSTNITRMLNNEFQQLIDGIESTIASLTTQRNRSISGSEITQANYDIQTQQLLGGAKTREEADKILRDRQNKGIGQLFTEQYGKTSQEMELDMKKTIVDASVQFKENMIEGIMGALEGSNDLGDSLQSAAYQFVKMINQKMMSNLVDRIVGGNVGVGGGASSGGLAQGVGSFLSNVFGSGGMASGGMINGGSGTKDDVPAMLMGGEYVVNKKAVSKYGPQFLEAINNGTLNGYAKGGSVQKGPQGNFYIPGTFGTGSISGKTNLLDFATQTATSGKYDQVINQGNYQAVSLEPESDRLSVFGMRNSPMFEANQSAKAQAFDLYVQQYNAEIEAKKQAKEQKKAFLKQVGIMVGMAALGPALGAAGAGAKAAFTGAKAGGATFGQSLLAGVKGIWSGGNVGGGVGNVGGLKNLFGSAGKAFSGDFAGASNQYKMSQIGSFSQLSNLYGSDKKFASFIDQSGGLGPGRAIPVNFPQSGGAIGSAWSSGYGRGYRMTGNAFNFAGNTMKNAYSSAGSMFGLKRATGGMIPSTSGVDTVPAMLSGGEFVMNRSAVQSIGAPNLQSMNSGGTSVTSEETSRELNEQIIAKLDELIGVSGSSGSITINVDSAGKSTEENSGGNSEQKQNLARQIKAAVLQVLNEEKRLGGTLRR